MTFRSIFAVTTLATAAAAQPADNAAPKEAATAFLLAQQQGDRAALERLLAPDFLFVRASGRIGDRSEYIAGFTAAASRIQAIDVADPLFLRLAPDAAVAGGEARLRGSENGARIAQHYRFSHHLVLRDGHWLIAYVQVTPLP
jgi:ketosteroid isomerase-like protein